MTLNAIVVIAITTAIAGPITSIPRPMFVVVPLFFMAICFQLFVKDGRSALLLKEFQRGSQEQQRQGRIKAWGYIGGSFAVAFVVLFVLAKIKGQL